MVDIFIGTAIGLATGLIAWWIVGRALTPKIVISPQISKLPDETGAELWRYRIKIMNMKRRWPLDAAAVELNVTATLRIRGLRESAPETWYDIDVPVGHTGELAYVKRNRALRLRLSDIVDRQARLLPDDLRSGIENGRIELERLFELGSRSRLRVVVGASHSYTHGRRTEVQRYKPEDVICGPFEESGVMVVEDPSLCEPPTPR